MRKLRKVLVSLVMFLVIPKIVWAGQIVEEAADIVYIPYEFNVYAGNYFGAYHLATFCAQEVLVVDRANNGWIKISSHMGYVWTRIAPPPSDILEGRIIILDAGHGIENSPAFADYVESVAMLDLALRIKPLLERHGATVLLTRSDQHDIHLTVRAAQINIWSLDFLHNARVQELYITQNEAHAENLRYQIAEIKRLIGVMENVVYDWQAYAPTYFNFPFDRTHQRVIDPDLRRIFELQADPIIRDNFLMFSLHSNATGRPINTEINGVDIYRMTNDFSNTANYFAEYSNVERTYHLSNVLMDNITQTGLAKRNIRPSNFFIIREHNLSGILVENGFHTNEHDRSLLSNGYFLQHLASAYEDAILQYFLYILQR